MTGGMPIFFKKRAELPKFKRKFRREAFRFPLAFRLGEAGARVFFPKPGWMRRRKSREIDGKPKNITASLAAGKWLAPACAERPFVVEEREDRGLVRIDMGIVNFATISDGTAVKPLGSFKKKNKS